MGQKRCTPASLPRDDDGNPIPNQSHVKWLEMFQPGVPLFIIINRFGSGEVAIELGWVRYAGRPPIIPWYNEYGDPSENTHPGFLITREGEEALKRAKEFDKRITPL